MNITLNAAKNCVMDVLKAGLVPFISSSPGIGKSDLVRSIAEENDLYLIDFRLSQADPTDMIGFPTVDKATNRMMYATPADFPIESDSLPEGYKGWILFFDEFNSAPMSVQASAYKIILDKQVGVNKLHKNVAIVAAGNLATDKAIVNRMSTAMQSRMVHFTIDVDVDAWVDWAYKNNIDYRVRSFIQFRPELLHKFDPKHNDSTFPAPRTWQFVSKIIKNKPKLVIEDIPTLAGTVGEGAGREFYGFSNIMDALPDIKSIITNPTTIPIPDEPSHLYAISGYLGNHVTDANIEPLVKYIERLPIEFQVISMRNVLATNRKLLTNPVVRKWTSTTGKELSN